MPADPFAAAQSIFSERTQFSHFAPRPPPAGSPASFGDAVHFQWNESNDATPPYDAQLIALDDALDSLAVLDPRKARVVEMRFFGGLSVEETAAVLKLSPQS